MKLKSIFVFNLLLIGAITGFSQTQVTLNTTPSRGMGQPQLFPEAGSPNRVEGREFYNPQGVALDTSGATPAVYVADLRNNRVLAWKNAAAFSNGATADLVVGQPDRFSTSAQGPGSTYPTGLNSPTGIAVYKGDLYVADCGNNRILRYPKPFNQQGPINPDLWIGQPNLNSRTANYTGQVSGQGIELSTSNSILQAGIAFDSAGNLWMSDPGNSRVLRFPAASISCSNCTAAADIVIGQANTSSQQATALGNNQASFVIKNQFGVVDGLAFDPTGRLYVTDQVANTQGRVLVFSNPSAQSGNASADRIMGVLGGSQLTGLTQAQFNTLQGQTFLSDPASVFFLADNSVGVVDTSANRILVFPPYQQWPAEATSFSPLASTVIGQTSMLLTSTTANQVATGTSSVTPPPNAGTLYNPSSAAFLASTNELFIADSGNNRVIVVPQSGTGFGAATRVLGQDRLTQFSPNLIEGKEFNFFVNGSYADGGMALDTSGTAPHLYVADPYNNRVLGFKDARKLSPTTAADIVIGQPDLATALCNYPTGDQNSPGQNTLCRPFGVAVDGQGNLYVADGLNGRVLRFPSPFAYTGGGMEPADLVLGQSTFTSSVRQPTSTTMGTPYAIAFSGTSGLVVSDAGYNRVVFIPFTANGTFNALTDNGKAATVFFGQASFGAPLNPAGNGLNQLNTPHGIACDSSGQVYVADTGNNRVLVFGDPNNSQTSAYATISLPSLNAPRSVYVNSGTGEIWVTNTAAGTLVRYPKYETLLFSPAATATLQDVVNNTLVPTIAVAQDQYGDLFVADAENHVIVYYQGFAYVNAATSLVRPLAPMMLATLYPLASATQFGANTATASAFPWLTTLGDIQVTVNGTPAPLYYISPGQINFYVPAATPPNANAEVEVVQVSTGQVLGAQQVAVNTIAPGIFTTCQPNQTGTLREACVLNQDFTVNSSSNPAARGSVVQIFGTGQGAVSNPPADGAAASASPLSTTASTPRVIMGTNYVDEYPAQPGDVTNGQWVTFSGLTPGLAGLWQVNVQIPMAVPPSTSTGGSTLLYLVLNNVPSADTTSGFRTYFYVK